MGGTALGGALRRGSDGIWYWADGTPELRVTDLSLSDWFRFPTREEDGQAYVEVPVSRAKTDAQLKWVRFGHYRITTSSTLEPEHTILSSRVRRRIEFEETPPVPQVYLVPKQDWDQMELSQMDARWDPAHHEDIIARAREVNSR